MLQNFTIQMYGANRLPMGVLLTKSDDAVQTNGRPKLMACPYDPTTHAPMTLMAGPSPRMSATLRTATLQSTTSLRRRVAASIRFRFCAVLHLFAPVYASGPMQGVWHQTVPSGQNTLCVVKETKCDVECILIQHWAY